jgi:DNA-binding NarL/FixJ family response regulator
MTTEPSIQTLTPRQAEIVTMLARGMTRKEVANTLGIALGTVCHHMGEAYSRLGVENLLEAANALGWVRVPEGETI